ncbi:uncharacterized protein VTP21DRAFT_253 [Calcarisporiella thermophila]|uniref:uncharacterized protein n=1 Tax=Calcarisporiella thermophila TaxID=911321 RepID=UPI003742FE6B
MNNFDTQSVKSGTAPVMGEAISRSPTPSMIMPSPGQPGAGSQSNLFQPLLSHSHLKPGHNASLLSYSQTLELYRQNARKTNDPNLQFDFSVFLVEASRQTEDDTQRQELMDEATKLLRQLSGKGHADAQFYLAECYTAGLCSPKGKKEYDKAFPLYVQASKHSHPDAAFEAAKCYEEGLGTRREPAKALQFYRKAATANHPGAMYRLAMAELNGELGLTKNPRDGVKWLKRAAEAATPEYPQAPHELALLHEKGIDNVVFPDAEYAVSLYAQAADLGHAPAAYRLGECYEYGRLGCPQDATLSIHYYTVAAQQGHKEACFALTAWYLVGCPNVLPQSDADAYAWALRAAEKGLPKAEYAIGYFTEVGIGVEKNPEEAMEWYKKAAEHGDKRALHRLNGTMPVEKKKTGKRGSSEECVIS